MNLELREGFWREALALQGSVTPLVAARVAVFGFIAWVVCGLSTLAESYFHSRLGLAATPHELAGAALGLVLVMRTNAGYDRWWEARKLWGGFVDRCRNLTISAMAYGPRDPEWRERVVRLVAAYPHVARHSLRKETPSANVENLLGSEVVAELEEADHMPSFIAFRLGDLLRDARERLGLDGFFFLQLDRERALLIDNYGGCERILNTPLPKVYSIKVRTLIVLFLVTLPFALLHRFESDWLVPPIMMLVAFPLLSLDQIGVELENPFKAANLSCLPLMDISVTIERNALAILQLKQEARESSKLTPI